MKKERISKREGIKKDITIKVKKIDNKTRKGDYVYIKYKGKQGRYYKYNEDIDLEQYIEAYERGIKLKRIGVSGIKKKIEEKARRGDLYLRKVKQRKGIDTFIKMGLTETKPVNVKKVDRKRVKEMYKEILEPLVDDKDILNIISNEENMKKMKHRLEVQIRIEGENKGFILVGRLKTAENVISDLMDIKRRNELWITDITELRKKGYELKDVEGTEIGDKYDLEGKAELISNIKKIEMVLRFSKGK